MTIDNQGHEHYVDGRLVAVILFVVTSIGGFAATTFWAEPLFTVSAHAVVCAVGFALVVLAWLNRGATLPKVEGQSYLLAFVLALAWSWLVAAVVLSQYAGLDEMTALLALLLASMLGGIAAAISARLWHERQQRIVREGPKVRRATRPDQRLAQVKERL